MLHHKGTETLMTMEEAQASMQASEEKRAIASKMLLRAKAVWRSLHG